MILDIRFKNSAPKQFQKVRMTTIYFEPDSGSGPELVIHFYDSLYPQVNIPLVRIVEIMTTND